MIVPLLAIAAQVASLQPLGKTATAITGPVRIAADSMTFGKRTVKTRKVATTMAVWDPGGDKRASGTVYRLMSDPGLLRGGNRLCGPREPARYVVVWRSVEAWGTTVTLGVWSSATAPTSVDSPGLCGTYSYE